MKYKFVDHPSDVKIRSYGKDLPQLFINSALGMMKYIYGTIPIKHDIKELLNSEINGPSKMVAAGFSPRTLEVTAETVDTLLMNWLNKILALSSINHCAYVKFSIKDFNEQKIIAEVYSTKIKAQNEIKAVTYHDFDLRLTKSGWVATVVYDI